MHLIHRMAEEEKEKKPYPKGKAPQSIQDFCTTTGWFQSPLNMLFN